MVNAYQLLKTFNNFKTISCVHTNKPDRHKLIKRVKIGSFTIKLCKKSEKGGYDV